MKNTLSVMIIVFLMMVSLSLTGCSKESPNSQTSAPVNTNQPGSNDELDGLLEAAGKTKDLSFDMLSTVTNAGQTISMQGKYWLSGDKMRMEMEAEGMNAVTIINEKNEIWMYNPADKTAMKIPKVDTKDDFPNEWTEADRNNMKIVDHEKVDGYDCTVVTITEGDDVSKMWLRKDIGLPVKMETKSPEGDLLIEYKNYKLEKQSADLFELPADAQILNIPDMSQMPGIPGN